jgi:hypothetical protein
VAAKVQQKARTAKEKAGKTTYCREAENLG